MKNDPIVEEVRKTREKLAARFNHNLDDIFKAAREKQKASGHEVVSFKPRKPKAG